MTPKEQDAAFKRLREKHPARPARWASGYVHGQQDAEIKEFADRAYAEIFMRTWPFSTSKRKQEGIPKGFIYAVGYIEGFAMIRGVDIEAVTQEALNNV